MKSLLCADCEGRALLTCSAGTVSCLFNQVSLVRISLSQEHLRDSLPANSPVWMTSFLARLQAYLAGERMSFQVPLDTQGASEFQLRVWRACQDIPYGGVESYGQVATRLGQPGAARAVGNALGANRFPLVIPCHRVVAGGNRLGGFGAGQGWKQWLLALEGVQLHL
jgi:O-6-methylguanine DNA methyltransferase